MIAEGRVSGPPGGGDSGTIPVILALGSNLGERRANLALGLTALEPETEVRHLSRLVESEPWGPIQDQPRFLNLVVRGRTRLSPRELLALIQRTEADAGRTRVVPQGPRTLDIDIVFFGTRTIRLPDLQVPHPHWQERPFVACLLADVAGEMVDPESGRPLTEVAPPGPLPPDLVEVPPLERVPNANAER